MCDGWPAWREALAFLLVTNLGAIALAEGPADELLRLAPPDAAVTLAVEDLSGHLRTVLDSPLAEGLGRLPAVREWLASDGPRRLERARKEIEAGLKVDAIRARDALLGEAFVLALHVPPGEPPDRAKGLLLTRVRDRELLLRLLETLNDAQRKDGSLADVASKSRGDAAYSVRTFRPGTKPPEAYAILGDTFAWSNSEALIQGVIDRRARAKGDGLGDLPGFRRVRQGLPAHPLALLFVDPKFLGRLLDVGQGPRTPQDAKVVEALHRTLATLEYAGAALRWQDGPILHLVEATLPDKAETSPRRAASTTPLAPATALAIASGPVDFGAVYDALMTLVPEADRPRIGHLAAILRGILLGKDARSEVLPRLGPGVLAYVDAPAEGEAWPPWAATVEVADADAAKAVANAVRTALSAYAVAREGKGKPLTIEEREAGGVAVTGLSGAPFAFASGRGRLAFGATPGAVAGAIEGPKGAESSQFAKARASAFAGASTFAYVDLEAVAKVVGVRRDALAKGVVSGRGGRVEDARRDLDQLLDLLKLFRFAFAAIDADPGPARARQTIGLIAKGAPTAKP